MIRKEILEAATRHTCGDRDMEYGPPFDNLTACAALFTAYLHGRFTGSALDPNQVILNAHDVAQLMVLIKMSRTFAGKIKRDTYEDQSAYAAIAGECGEILKAQKETE
jgi:hypothetical protein